MPILNEMRIVAESNCYSAGIILVDIYPIGLPLPEKYSIVFSCHCQQVFGRFLVKAVSYLI
jgi:hypothetical protein